MMIRLPLLAAHDPRPAREHRRTRWWLVGLTMLTVGAFAAEIALMLAAETGR